MGRWGKSRRKNNVPQKKKKEKEKEKKNICEGKKIMYGKTGIMKYLYNFDLHCTAFISDSSKLLKKKLTDSCRYRWFRCSDCQSVHLP